MNANETKSSKIWLVAIFAVFFCMPCVIHAQEGFSRAELDPLVANIALYPDPLLVQVLSASTYGEQIAPAAQWAEEHKHLKGKDLSVALERAKLPYDASVQALIPFPQVLTMMADYGGWTDQLGYAVVMQKNDVMAAIQRLRHTASKFGHLRSDQYVKVSNGDNITITPVRTEYVYVPVYNPHYVYYRYYDGYTTVTYTPGVWLGSWFGFWGWGACWFDWHSRAIYVRRAHWHPRWHYPRYPHRYVHSPRRYAPPPRRHHVAPPPPHRHHAAPPPPHRHHAAPPPPRREHRAVPVGHNPPPPPPKKHYEPQPKSGFHVNRSEPPRASSSWPEPKNYRSEPQPAQRSRSYEDDSNSSSRYNGRRDDDSRDNRGARSSSHGSSHVGAGRVINRR